MNYFLADMLGTTWFILLTCGISFVAGIALASKIKAVMFGR
jgi:hypothetical protein